MRALLSVGLLVGLSSLGIAPAKAALLYIDDSNGNIGTVDTSTGTVKVIGSSGAGLTDIGFTKDGTLYGTSYNSLYSINTSTGAATKVGDYTNGIYGVNALVGYGNGLLAASYGPENLYSIGVSPFSISTLSGSTGGGAAGDLAFAASGGALYGTQSNGNLVKYTINGNSFTSSIVGNTGNNAVYGLATDLNGTTYAVAGTEIYTVNLTTAALTPLLDYSGHGLSGANGTAFFGEATLSPVPLPASAPMFGAALLGLAGFGYIAKRKKAAIAA